MTTLFVEIGVFTIALVLIMLFQMYELRKKYRDCMLFCRLLLATVGILFIDTLGWVIDGTPICGQIWFTVVVDGLDLILTTTVCCCWVQYAVFISDEKNYVRKKWYKDIGVLLLLLQITLVISSQFLDFYYYVDEFGAYHRGRVYVIHTLISLILLAYSSGKCILARWKEKSEEKKKELLFVALIILIPIAGNVIQLYVYGYPTVWLCMVFMVLTVYIHIQNKRMIKERQEQNRILELALKQAQDANMAKTEFLARMSHDMRTPMNGILGLTYLMESENNVEELKSELPMMRESGEYLLQLINDVLDVNKVESGKVELQPKVCDEEEVFRSILAMIRPQMEKKSIDFHVEMINIKWTYMLLDVQRVKQIFVNLLTNAIKFTPQGGRIDFVMELVSEDEHMIRDKFIIRDSGIGMSEEFLPNLFKPFSQENRIHENLGGTGLGLSIVKNLVELMGGTISVKSKINKGSEFTLYLNFPLAKKPDSLDKAKQAQRDAQLPENLRILLCEDHPLNAQIMKRLLEIQKAVVTWAEDGEQGVEEFQKSKEYEYDIILMDIRMPVLDGIAATKKIRQLERTDAKQIPIIAVTANAYEDDVKKSIEAGMNAHLSKPIEPQKLFETLEQYAVGWKK